MITPKEARMTYEFHNNQCREVMAVARMVGAIDRFLRRAAKTSLGPYEVTLLIEKSSMTGEVPDLLEGSLRENGWELIRRAETKTVRWYVKAPGVDQ